MNQKKVRGQKIRWIAMIVASAVLWFFSTVAFAAEEALQNRPLDSKQILLTGGMAPDYPGFDTAPALTIDKLKKKEPTWNVGAGVGMVPDYEGSEDYKVVPLLFARAGWNSGRYVQFFANTLKAS